MSVDHKHTETTGNELNTLHSFYFIYYVEKLEFFRIQVLHIILIHNILARATRLTHFITKTYMLDRYRLKSNLKA